MIDKADLARLHEFIDARRMAVIASASCQGIPEAALMDIAVSASLEIVFETTRATRKFLNFVENPSVSVVVGWDDEKTLQCDGVVDVLTGADRDRLKALYLSSFPGKASHEFWPGNGYFRIRPHWARLSNYNSPRKIEEFDFPSDELRSSMRNRGLFGWLRGSRSGSGQRN